MTTVPAGMAEKNMKKREEAYETVVAGPGSCIHTFVHSLKKQKKHVSSPSCLLVLCACLVVQKKWMQRKEEISLIHC